ncbi:group II intron maturase-specific domain-containing protein [Nonomuraea sp. NPDC049695]|uniref:group II intron maturase-specific domain-containing protein n=1 Tax=Nonomuraea sp. NPDC049695 TaxID=3154734 RepID=UPI0034212771
MLLSPEAIVQDLNSFLRGWAGYFRYGHSGLSASARSDDTRSGGWRTSFEDAIAAAWRSAGGC